MVYCYMKNRERDIDTIKRMINFCGDAESLLERYDHSFEKYKTDIAFQYSCNMCVIQIGGLVERLSDDCMETHQEIPWHAIRAMRNLHAHEYEKVNLEIVWKTLTKRVPELKQQLENILHDGI